MNQESRTPGPQFSPPRSFVDRYSIHPTLFAFGCLAVIFLLYQVGGAVLTLLFVKGPNVTKENVAVVRLITVAGQVVLMFLPTLLFARLLTPRLRDVFALRVPSWRESGLALVALLSLQRLFEVYGFFQDQIPFPEVLKKFVEPFKHMFHELVKTLVKADSTMELLFVIVVIAIVPAIVEEMLFRGVIQSTFERTMTPLASALAAGAIFGVFHLNPFDAIPLVGLGCFLGYLRYRSKSILVPIGGHFVNNLLAVFAVYFGVDDEKVLTTPVIGSPTLAMMALQFALFGGLFVYASSVYVRLTDELHHSGRDA